MSKQTGLKMSAIVIATLFLTSLLGATLMMVTPGSTKVEARDEAGCRTVPVSLDEGYSISRIEMRQVCGFDR